MAVLAVGGGYWVAMTLSPASPEAPPVAVIGAIETADAGAIDIVGAVTGLASSASTGKGEDQLILDVLDTFERRPNSGAKIRQSVRLGDDRLTGEGQFW